ncbi:DUF885 domain-containing protein [Solimonas variicoloris]|uniref:DUF885 domain-containing protein n=1 Tax=Solimonas variicoloris TaxID=254408 RepID=UPI0003A01F22|nr:DUF885 family protein [Solimonas variicoloris]
MSRGHAAGAWLAIVAWPLAAWSAAPLPAPPALQAAVDAYEAADCVRDADEDSPDAAEPGRRQLPDVSPAAERACAAKLREVDAALAAIDPAALPADARLTHELLRWTIAGWFEALPFDESRLPFNSDGGFDVTLLYRASQPLADEKKAQAWLQLLSEVPRWYAQNIANARRGIKTGFVQPKPTAEAVLKRARRATALGPDDDPLLAPLRALPASLPEARRAELLAQGEKLVRDGVVPARRDFARFMAREYLPHAAQSLAASDLPDGRAYYAFLVRRHTTTDLTPDQVHDIGLQEVARIRAEMERTLREAGFDGTLAAFIAWLRHEPRFYATSRQQLLEKAAEIAKRIDGELPAHFGTLPRLTYGVRPVPAEIEDGYTTGRYFSGDPRQHRAGGLMINTSHLEQRPLYELPALVLHEGVPGHHLQVALAQEQADAPKFRRNLYVTTYGEGWGLYAERLGETMGIYRDPYERFGRLSYEMWRACRLVADTGLHWKHWTLDEARACFADNTALSPLNIEVELQRYVSWPGQALAYKMGELKLVELRRKAEAALGDRFDERGFHDALLLHGALPLSVLERQVDAWIAARQTE